MALDFIRTNTFTAATNTKWHKILQMEIIRACMLAENGGLSRVDGKNRANALLIYR